MCRELGYRRALFTTFGELFEQQSGDIWIEEALCTGNESSIFHCDLTYIRDSDEAWGCNHNHEGGVICESSKEPGLNSKYFNISLLVEHHVYLVFPHVAIFLG